MPQASEELRSIMEEEFGDGVDDSGPIRYLEDKGYILTRKWTWKPKHGVTTLEDMEQMEWYCLLFLIQEWDFGGLEV